MITSIGGELTIYLNNSLEDLTGLENLLTVGGDIWIFRNPMLSSLNGIGNIQANSIKNLYIYQNDSLSDCDVQFIIDYLMSPQGTVNIYNNFSGCNSPADISNTVGITIPCLPFGNYYLTSQNDVDSFQFDYPDCANLGGGLLFHDFIDDISNLNGMTVVKSIDSNLYLAYNTKIQNLTGLDSLEFIGGDLIIRHLDSINSLEGLNSLDSVGGSVTIYHNDELFSFSGLENLIGIGQDLHIGATGWEGQSWGNHKLADISSLSNLTGIPGDIALEHNHSLENLNGLENITTIGGDLYLHHNLLNNLNGLVNLTSVGGDLRIVRSNTILSLEGLGKLEIIEGDLTIYENNYLVDISDLINLTFLGESLLVSGNDSLISLNGLEGLSIINGRLVIGHNGQNDLSGLENITEVHGDVYISGNKIVSLTGLDNLMTIGEDLKIGYTDSLSDISMLTNLTSIDGVIGIYYNKTLTNIAGLDNIDAASISSLEINNNPNLSVCAVKSICEYLASPNGEVVIENNANGCDTQEQVDSACIYVSVHERIYNLEEVVSPNPFTISTTIAYNLEEATTIQITIYNHLGARVAELVNGHQISGKHQIVWHADNLQAGVYFCVLRTEVGMQTTKLMKLK